jgi:hypothetical protein
MVSSNRRLARLWQLMIEIVEFAAIVVLVLVTVS